MNKTQFGIFSLILATITICSCSVEKRIHQDGYHISWKHRHSAPSELTQVNEISSNEEVLVTSTPEVPEPNVHSVETISANSNEDIALILLDKKSPLLKSKSDTIVPDQTKQQEEYFVNNYTNPLPTNELLDTKLANWALGLGIGAISSPLIITLTTLLIFTLLSASWANASIWLALGLALIIGGGIFITLEVLAITFAVRFLRKYGKDPNYRKYRSRAITGLILAGIYPALMLINLIIAIALGI